MRHAPHFDWVVAHLGSCFPHTVTSRVLSLGLKDFAASAAGSPGSAEMSLGKPRLVSVVNILSHLATTHPIQLEAAVQELVQSSLAATSNSPTTSAAAAVPFLLHLSSLSSGVRRALACGLAPRLASALPRLAALAPTWAAGRFFASADALATQAAHLLVQTDRGGPELVLVLLRLGGRPEREVATVQARSLSTLILAELTTLLHSTPRHRPEEAPLLAALDPHLPSLLPLLLSENSFQRAATTHLLSLHSLHRGRAASASLLAHMLVQSSTSAHLATLGHLLASLELWHPGAAADSVARALRRGEGEEQGRLLDNLARLVVTEGKGEVAWHSSYRRAVRSHLSALASLVLAEPERVLLLLSMVPPGPRLRLAALHRLAHALVQLVYSTVSSATVTEEQRARRLGQVEVVLCGMARQPAVLQATLRLLLEAALHSPYALHLGGDPALAEEAAPRHQAAASLLKENLKFGSMPVQPLGSTTVFHAGTIGAGPRPAPPPRPVPAEQEEENRREVAGLVVRLCEAQGQEGTKQLALLLVEMVSPDIMYNGLPWPEDEFIKVATYHLTTTSWHNRHLALDT